MECREDPAHGDRRARGRSGDRPRGAPVKPRVGGIASAGAIAVACAAAGAGDAPMAQPDHQAVQLMVAGGNAFACDLYAQLDDERGNFFFSPLSIRTALTMTAAGADDETLAQMERVLHLDLSGDRLHHTAAWLQWALTRPPSSEGQAELLIANGLWLQRGMNVKGQFLGVLRRHYRVQPHAVDFRSNPEEARSQVNRWVERQTRELITDLFPSGSIDTDTRLVLANAVYFLGRWRSPFSTGSTREGEFRLSRERAVPAELMHQVGRFEYAEAKDLQVLQMRYRSGVAALVLLPRDVEGLPAVAARLSAGNLAALAGRLKPTQVDVTLPKFTMSTELSLAEVLTRMGMIDAFNEHADFAPITDSARLLVQAVLHKAHVRVDEEGTEAAAATGVAGGLLGAPSKQPVVFRADHPFVFIIRDTGSGSIIFMGRVAQPG